MPTSASDAELPQLSCRGDGIAWTLPTWDVFYPLAALILIGHCLAYDIGAGRVPLGGLHNPCTALCALQWHHNCFTLSLHLHRISFKFASLWGHVGVTLGSLGGHFGITLRGPKA